MSSLRARIHSTLNVDLFDALGRPTTVPVSYSLKVEWVNGVEFTERLRWLRRSKAEFNRGLRAIMRARAEGVQLHVQGELLHGTGNAPLSPATERIYAARRRLRTRGYRNLRQSGLGGSNVDRGYTGPNSKRPLVRSGKLMRSIVVKDRSRTGANRFEFEVGPTPTAKTASGLPIRDLIRILETGFHIFLGPQRNLTPDDMNSKIRLFRGMFGAAFQAGTEALTGMPRRLHMPARKVLQFPSPSSEAARRIEWETRQRLQELFRSMDLPASVFVGGAR